MNGSNKPKRKVSYQEKVRDNFKYCKQWIDWCINSSRYRGGNMVGAGYTYPGNYNAVYNNNLNQDLPILYELASGRIPPDWFTYITNPFNFGADKQLPAKIEDINLLTSDLFYFEGKKEERPFNYMVNNVSSTAGSQQLEDLNRQINEELMKVWNEDEDAAKSPKQFEDIINSFILSYKDNKALRGQDILTYILQDDRTKEKLLECWRHWLIAGEAYCKIEVIEDEVRTTPISPVFITVGYSTYDFDNKYVEDQDWVSVRYYWSATEIIDRFKDVLTEKQVKKFDETVGSVNSAGLYHTPFIREFNENPYFEKIECIHCQWKVFRKTGIVDYPDPLTGKMESMEVDESFVLDDTMKELGYSLRWVWETETWEGWKIQDEYIDIKLLPFQNGKFNYYGRKFRNLHSLNTSVVRMALPYIKLYCVIWYKLELAIAKSKGQLLLMPIEALIGGEGSQEWGYKEFLYSAEALGIGLYSMSNPALKGNTLNNLMGSPTISAVQEATFLLQMAEFVKQSWMNTIGLSAAAKAQQTTDKGLGVTQSEIYQSSVITEPIFTQFEYFEERLLQAMLDMSQFAYLKGKKATVLRDDNSLAYLEVDGEDHLNSDYGVFVQKSGEEARKLEAMRQLAMELGSQGQDPSKLAEIIYAKNSAQLKKVLYDLKNMEIKQAQQQAESEEKLKQETIQIQQAYKQFEMEMEVEKARGTAEAEFPYKKELELIKLEANQLSFQGNLDTNANGIPDVNEVEKRSNERLKMNLDAKLKVAELGLKNKEIESKERTEQLKAKVALKNKVSGEK